MRKLVLLIMFGVFISSSISQDSWSTKFPESAVLRNKDQFRQFWDQYGLGLYNSSGGQFPSSNIIVKDNILTIPFNAGDWGGSGTRNAGAMIYQSLPRFTGKTAYLEYEMKFGPNFDWGVEGEQYRGGKHGYSLQVGDLNVGKAPNRGNFGFTTMWRDGGNLDCYFYYSEQSSNWPDRRIYYKAKRDVWYKFGMEVILNDFGKQNGILRIYIDDKVEYELTGLLLSTSPTGSNEFKVAFGNFFGGDSDAWRSRTNSNLQFKDATVYRVKPGSSPDPECPPAGQGCDDGDPSTVDDMEDGNCNCSGTPAEPDPIDTVHVLLDSVRIDVGSSIDPYVEGGSIATYQSPLGTVYGTERYGPFTYTIPVNPGTYDLSLYMANQWEGTSQVGQRVFHIDVNGKRAITDLDLVSQFGHNVAGMIKLPVETDSVVEISFIPKVQNPLLNGLTLLPSDSVIAEPEPDSCLQNDEVIQELQEEIKRLELQVIELLDDVNELTADNLSLESQISSLNTMIEDLKRAIDSDRVLKGEMRQITEDLSEKLKALVDLLK